VYSTCIGNEYGYKSCFFSVGRLKGSVRAYLKKRLVIMQPDEMEKHTKTYEAIIGFYDLAEKLVDSVEHPEVSDPVSQLEFVEPIVKQLEEATDVLSEEYRSFVATGKAPGFLAKKKIEKAIKTINTALLECKDSIAN
jgi:hypothetical protein